MVIVCREPIPGEIRNRSGLLTRKAFRSMEDGWSNPVRLSRNIQILWGSAAFNAKKPQVLFIVPHTAVQNLAWHMRIFVWGSENFYTVDLLESDSAIPPTLSTLSQSSPSGLGHRSPAFARLVTPQLHSIRADGTFECIRPGATADASHLVREFLPAFNRDSSCGPPPTMDISCSTKDTPGRPKVFIGRASVRMIYHVRSRHFDRRKTAITRFLF